MARPHIMFIQAQDLPWQQGLHGRGRDDVEMKVLSMDEAGTDASAIVRYPAGWSRSTPEVMAAHEEILVLDGALTINGQTYTRHQYCFLSAGYPRTTARSDTGCVAFTTFSDKPDISPGTGTGYDEKLLVSFVDPLTMDWSDERTDKKFAGGTTIKMLRDDPYTGEMSFLYCTRPHRVPAGMKKPAWTHPMIEEIYTLDGEYVWGDLGRMGPGGYCWWVDGKYHGPAGTDVGYHLFVRTVNGPLANTIGEDPLPFNFEPEFKPELPDELRALAKPYQRPPNY